ncbi:helix-turn-helix transcriptional regulator [Streptomyces sp. NPDC005863]|uniref:helix-turn-helix transcriptional regulator n=1 Tax=unclassified Streptomyces TaxID=2593676 RepID=UPI0033FD2A3D
MPPAPPSSRVLAARRAVGDRIRVARLRAKLSRERLAEKAGLDRHAVNRIEQGHASPLLDNLIRIADALGVPLRDLVRPEEGPTQRTSRTFNAVRSLARPHASTDCSGSRSAVVRPPTSARA